MYNFIESIDNYSDTSGSLWQFKRDEIEGDVDLTANAQNIINNSSSFKYKSICTIKLFEQLLMIVRNAID